MKKLMVLSLFTAIALIVSSCSVLNPTSQPAVNSTSGLPNTGATATSPVYTPTLTPFAPLAATSTPGNSPYTAPTSVPTETAQPTDTALPSSTPQPTQAFATPTEAVSASEPTSTATNSEAAPADSSNRGLAFVGNLPALQTSQSIGLQVIGPNGNPAGKIIDMVLNQCRIVYVVLQADPSLGFPSGKGMFLIPFQELNFQSSAATASGTASQTVVLDLNASLLASAPLTNNPGKDIDDLVLEKKIVDFWSQYAVVPPPAACNPANVNSPASTSTPVPSATATISPTASLSAGYSDSNIFAASYSFNGSSQSLTATPGSDGSDKGNPKRNAQRHIVLLSDLLNHNLHNNSEQFLGTIKDILFIPSSGIVSYILIQPATPAVSGQLSAVPLQATELRHIDLNGNKSEEVIFKLKQAIFNNAPIFSSLPDTSQPGWDSSQAQYWSQYVK